MTQDDYVVMKRSTRDELIRELKEVKKENQQLKKQKADVVEYIKKQIKNMPLNGCKMRLNEILRMLGEIDETSIYK